jgi:hypothetical protein
MAVVTDESVVEVLREFAGVKCWLVTDLPLLMEKMKLVEASLSTKIYYCWCGRPVVDVALWGC